MRVAETFLFKTLDKMTKESKIGVDDEFSSAALEVK